MKNKVKKIDLLSGNKRKFQASIEKLESHLAASEVHAAELSKRVITVDEQLRSMILFIRLIPQLLIFIYRCRISCERGCETNPKSRGKSKRIGCTANSHKEEITVIIQRPNFQ